MAYLRLKRYDIEDFRVWMAEVRSKQKKHCPNRRYASDSLTYCVYCDCLHELMVAFCLWFHTERDV